MSNQENTKPLTLEHNQNFWQLACIQVAGVGLPGMLIGGEIAKNHGPLSALVAICIANLLLWILGFCVTQMCSNEKSNAVENVYAYSGKLGAMLFILTIILAFFAWFTLQTRFTMMVMSDLLKLPSNSDTYLRIGAAIGAFTALLSIKHIRMIRWLCVSTLPVFILFLLYRFSITGSWTKLTGSWVPPISAIILIIVAFLPGFVNLPTFFRHARSKEDAILGLSLTVILLTLIQSSFILTNTYTPTTFLTMKPDIYLNTFLSLAFIFAALITANILNIYFASAAWESIVSHSAAGKEYVIIGLAGTAAFSFIQITAPMSFIETLSTNLIGNMGVVLMIDFTIRLIVKHRPRKFGKIISLLCWALGSTVSTLTQLNHPDSSSLSFIAGLGSSILSFVLILFIEETTWSIKDIFKIK